MNFKILTGAAFIGVISGARSIEKLKPLGERGGGQIVDIGMFS
jgi:hypothetical protein